MVSSFRRHGTSNGGHCQCQPYKGHSPPCFPQFLSSEREEVKGRNKFSMPVWAVIQAGVSFARCSQIAETWDGIMGHRHTFKMSRFRKLC